MYLWPEICPYHYWVGVGVGFGVAVAATVGVLVAFTDDVVFGGVFDGGAGVSVTDGDATTIGVGETNNIFIAFSSGTGETTLLPLTNTPTIIATIIRMACPFSYIKKVAIALNKTESHPINTPLG